MLEDFKYHVVDICDSAGSCTRTRIIASRKKASESNSLLFMEYPSAICVVIVSKSVCCCYSVYTQI